MKRTKKLPGRRDYRRRILRNLLVCALIALVLWVEAGYPLPRTMSFRRLERQSLLERSEIFLEIEGRVSGDRDILLGMTENHIHAAAPETGTLVAWDRNPEGATLVALPERVRYYNRGSYLGPAFVGVDPPEGTAAARLTVTLYYDGEINGRPVNWEEDYVMEGDWRDSCWFFQMVNHHDPSGIEPVDFAEQNWFFSPRVDFALYEMPPYTLIFYDAAGDLLETASCGMHH